MRTDLQSPNDIRTIINKSIDVKYYKHDLWLVSIGYIFLLVFLNIVFGTALWGYQAVMLKLMITYSSLITILYVPFIVAFIAKLLRIMKRPEDYIFFNMVLGEPHVIGTTAFFTVSISIDNTVILVDTKRIYHIGWKKPHVNEFKDRAVTIGYNKSSREVIVID